MQRLPHKGNIQTAGTQIKTAAQWVRGVSSTVTRVQAKVRSFLAQRRAAKARSEQKEQAEAEPAGAGGGGGGAAAVEATVERTNSDDIAMLQRVAFPEEAKVGWLVGWLVLAEEVGWLS